MLSARRLGKTRGAIGFAAVAGVPKGHLRHFKIKKAGYRFFFEFLGAVRDRRQQTKK
jgi:hypothetical protein